VSRYSNVFLHDLGLGATIHKLRHRFGTQALHASGGNVRTAQEALRHRSITSTQRYTYVHPSEVRAAIEKIPPA
jgi:site-specific recombinase XerD